VPSGCQEFAYCDHPLRSGNVHISAPHIYCTVVDNLELEINSCQSFLNIGVGTGYLSCVVSQILGPRSQSFGVEIHSDVVEHCLKAIKTWKNSVNTVTIEPTIIHGNGLEISNEGESIFGYDRIYVGAAITSTDLRNIQQLLAPGGILIAPVEGRLTKIKRLDEFAEQIITSVNFAPLLAYPKISVAIPALMWRPEYHHLYPKSFQDATRTLLLCSGASFVQPPKKASERLNFSSVLPKEIWVHILSFTTKKWFEPERGEFESIKARLKQEKSKRGKLELENIHLHKENSSLVQEKNLYLSLIQKLRRALDQQLELQIEEEDPFSRTTFDLLNETDNLLNIFNSTSRPHEMEVDNNSSSDVGEQYGMDVESLNSDDDSEQSEWEPSVNDSNRSVRVQHRTVSITNDDF